MIVTVKDGAIALYSYDTDKKQEGLFPATADKPDIRQALKEALKFLGKDDTVPSPRPAPEGA